MKWRIPRVDTTCFKEVIQKVISLIRNVLRIIVFSKALLSSFNLIALRGVGNSLVLVKDSLVVLVFGCYFLFLFIG